MSTSEIQERPSTRRRGGPQQGTGAVRQRRKPSPARLLSASSRVNMWGGFSLGLAFYILFGIVPTAANLLMSFTDYSGLPGSPTSFVGAQNYDVLVTSQGPGFVGSLFDTLYFVVGVTLIQNVIAMMLAHRLQGEGKVAWLLRLLAFIPIVLGVTVVGIVWLMLFDPQSGPAGAALGAIGVHSAFFGSTGAAMPLTIIVQVWQNLGFTMLVYIGGLKVIPREIYEAADIDGVTPWRRFTSITWPLMAPAVTVNVLLAVLGSLTTFNLIFILTDGQFGTNTLGIFAFNTAFGQTQDLGLGAAVSTVLLVVAVLVGLPLLGFLRSRERRFLA